MNIFRNFDFRSTLNRMLGKEQKKSLPNNSAPLVQTPVSQPAEAAISLTIWTVERSRYAQPRAICTEYEVYPSQAVVLCDDISAYVIDTPNGECVVVESRTGSLVGHSLEVVRDGIREMTRLQLNTQLDTARKEFNRLQKQMLSHDDFWKAIKMANEEAEVVQDYQE